ncbi:MAG: alpha/beta hydrolase [Devosia sp.]
MVSTAARAEIARMFAEREEQQGLFPDGKPLAERRADWDNQMREMTLPFGTQVSPVNAGEIKSEWVETPGATRGRVLLLLHGGGYNSGSPLTHRKLAALLGAAARMRVLVPDYRLAPEHRFPAAVDDALAALTWLKAEGIAEDRVVVAGDSAGGGLALSLLLRLRDVGAAMPRAAVLLSPWTDLSVSSPSYEQMRGLDPIITPEGLAEAGRWYAGEGGVTDPMASPLFANLRGLPPLLIHAGGDETMLDDSRIFAQRAKEAGVAVSYKEWPGLWHVFHHAAPDVPEAVEAMSEVAAFIRSQFGGQLD